MNSLRCNFMNNFLEPCHHVIYCQYQVTLRRLLVTFGDSDNITLTAPWVSYVF